MATITGTQGNDALVGTAQADLLQGLGGNDLLDGGLGNDTMEGGDGDDTYVIRDTGDVITEGATEGANDLAFVDVVNFALSSGQTVGTYTASANVEAVSALEQAGTQAFNIIAAATTRTVAGNAGANVLTGAGTVSQTLIGLAGNDTYNVSGNTQLAQEAAGGGTDILNVTLAAGGTAAERTYNMLAGSEIETVNLLGAAAVSFTGNATVQTINGSAQGDTIDGGGGADFISAGGGDDTIAVSTGVRVDGGAGTDRVISSTGYALTGQTATVVNTNVELLELAGRSATATTVAATNTATTGNFLVGDQGAQLIIGDNGTNTLLGAPTATGAGGDTLVGLGGNDVYRVYSQTDVVLEGSSTTGVDTGGFDTVFTSVDYSLLQNDINAAAATAANALFTDEATVQQIEVLSAADQAGTTALTLTGNTLAQTIIGNAGANTLNTGGGTAIDRLIGLGGNDTYNVDVLGTVIEEGAGQGTADVANVSVTGYALTTDAQVEIINFTLTTGGTVTGNAFAQTINGNTGADTLIGGGGADTLVGGAGNDSYTVDSLDDVVTEAAAGGTDTVLAVSSYALTAGAEVEVLAANGFAGPGTTTPATTLAATNTTTDAIYLVGNEFAQVIYGSGGDNIILGSAAANGNAGVNDTLVGLGGNDTYRVFSSGDVVVEGTNGGNDIVFTNTNFSLAANTTAAAAFATGLTDAPGTTAGVGNIETLSAANQADTTALTLLGDAGNNTIIGNNGSNTLGGGAGNDTLIGLGRGDQFYFAEFGVANADVIQDFSAVNGGDRILLNTTAFTGLTANGSFLADSSFRLSNDTQPATTAGTIVYDQGTGQLFYDSNGTGVAGGINLIATLTPGTSVVASDIALTATAPTI